MQSTYCVSDDIHQELKGEAEKVLDTGTLSLIIAVGVASLLTIIITLCVCAFRCCGNITPQPEADGKSPPVKGAPKQRLYQAPPKSQISNQEGLIKNGLFRTTPSTTGVPVSYSAHCAGVHGCRYGTTPHRN